MDRIPEVLINYNVYLEGGRLIGLTDAELPKFDYYTEEVSGAGIFGAFEVPIPGNYKSMTMKLNFRLPPTHYAAQLQEPRQHMIELRSSTLWANGRSQEKKPYHVTALVMPKSTEIGKAEVGKPTGSGIELEILFIQIIFDGRELMYLDKMNAICRINGIDQTKEVRDQI